MTREQKLKRRRELYQKNKQKNKQKQKEYNKQYRINNKEKIAKKDKKLYEKKKNLKGFKEHKLAIQREYRKKYPNKMLIQHWKCRGMIDTDWDLVYQMYIAQTNCWICDRPFDDKYKRNLDHNHDTGELRYVVCNPCNIHIIG